MSRTTVEAWKCDVCGFEWLMRSDKEPECCASQKCRSRKWNAKARLEAVMGPPIEIKVDTKKLGVAILEQDRQELIARGCEHMGDGRICAACAGVQNLEVGGKATFYPNVCNCGSLTGGHRSKCPMYKGKK